MNKSEAVALIDMDGTLCDYNNALSKSVSQVLGDEKVNSTVRDNIEHLIKSQPGWWRNLAPIPFGLHIANTLEKHGFKLMVLTKGPIMAKNAWTEKVEWCAEFLPHANVTITHDKGLVYGKILVDDWPPYINRWLEWRPRGMVIMPRQHWNENFSHPNVYRVESEDDVFKLHDRIDEVYNR